MSKVSIVVLPREARALHALPLKMAVEIEDDEEEAFLKVNESLVLVFDIDAVKIVEQYKSDKVQKIFEAENKPDIFDKARKIKKSDTVEKSDQSDIAK